MSDSELGRVEKTLPNFIEGFNMKNAITANGPIGHIQTTTIDGSLSWHHEGPSDRQYKTAQKLLHDPNFSLDKIIVELVARYLMRYENGLMQSDQIIDKYLHEKS